jgi:glc operon protein GlcG
MKHQFTRLISVLALSVALSSAYAQGTAPATAAAPASTEAPVAQTLGLPYGQDIGWEQANRVMAAAMAYARSKNWNVTIAVTDTSGNVVAMNRFDGAHKASPDFAMAKARSAAMLKRSTKVFADALLGGRMAILGFTDLNVHSAEGGEVLVQNGRIVGGIGAAGVTEKQDREISLAGLAALQ